MKPLEIIAALADHAVASGASLPSSPDAILNSPAFAMPCRLGEEQATLCPAEVAPLDTLDLEIAFGDEPHTLSLVRSPAFPELDKVWDARSDVPAPILLALVEKECGPLFQMLENAVRKQLRLVGVEDSLRRGAKGAEAQSRAISICLSASSASLRENNIITFSLTRSASVVSAFGVLRNLDLSHESIRSVRLSAVVEYASFALPDSDVASLAPGDALLLPEIGSISPRLVVDGSLVIDENGVSQAADDGTFRIRAAEAVEISLGEMMDAAGELKVEKLKVESSKAESCRDGAQLRLVRSGKAVAAGRLGRLGDHPAFLVESLFGSR